MSAEGDDDPYADGQLYDMEYAGHDEDLGWYVDRARTAPGPVLELGCGTGRLTVPMARAGARVHGVDRAAGMLERLAVRTRASDLRSRVSWQCADYLADDFEPRDPTGTETWGAVLWPFNALHHCESPERVRRVLERSRDRLLDDGVMAMDCYLPDRALYSRDPEARYEYRTFVDPRDGGMLESWEQGWWDDANRVHHVTYSYRNGEGRVWRSHLALHMYELDELRALVEGAGWRIDREVSDFTSRRLSQDSLKWIVLLRKR